MAVKLPDPAVTAARMELKQACQTLDESVIRNLLKTKSSLIQAAYGPQSSDWNGVRDRLLSGVDLDGIGLPADRVNEIRSGLLLHSFIHNSKPAPYVASALLGLVLDAHVWPAFWEERGTWKRKAPAAWDAVLLSASTGISLGADELVDLSANARGLLAHTGTVAKVKTGHLHTFWIEPTLDIDTTLFQALQELEDHGLARGTEPVDRLRLLTAAQLVELFPECGDSAKSKSALVDAVSAIFGDEEILARLERFPDAASPYLVTVGTNRGKDADWLLSFSSLLADWLLRRAEVSSTVQVAISKGGAPGGWHVIRADRCKVCAIAPDNIAQADVEKLPPFHIGCHCFVIADGPYGLPPGLVEGMRRAPRSTATKSPGPSKPTPAKAAAPRKTSPRKASPRKASPRKPAKRSKQTSILGAVIGGVLGGLSTKPKRATKRQAAAKRNAKKWGNSY